MSLLVTSCTMGKQPDRLLDKGPQYLRTRTNRGMFAHHRKSAVELLAASKAQFYKVPSASAHNHHELIQPSDLVDGQGQNPQEERLSRSKSEFDILTLKSLTNVDNGWDDDATDNTATLDNTRSPTGDEPKSVKQLVGRTSSKNSTANVVRRFSVGDTEVTATSPISANSSLSFQYKSMQVHISPKSEECQTPPTAPEIYLNTRNNSSVPIPGKPIPLPRKHLDKPVPPPRTTHRKLPRKPSTASETSEERYPTNSSIPSPNSSFADGRCLNHGSETDETVNLAAPKRKRSLVETLAQHFTSLCTDFQFSSSLSTKSPPSDVVTPSTKELRKNSNTECSTEAIFQATPIYIPQERESNNTVFQARPVSLYLPSSKSQNPESQEGTGVKPCQNSADSNNNVKGRKRYPETPMSSNTSSGTRERKASVPESIPTSPLSRSDAYSFSPVSGSCSKGPASEMSIESVERVVYDSEVNAIPSAITTSIHSLEGGHGEPHEVTRVSSSLSGKMDAQDASSHLTHSPTHPTASVPRSHSDISCRLEGQHSRDSSLMSNRSRLSRASCGADLEKFFNQMGLEKGILDPITQLKELQNSEILASVSSLDSHDASSIGSTFSGSENDCSESQSMERSQQPTSVVERNARIIKWLCNVRRAKSQSSNIDGAGASNSSTSPTAGNA